MFSIIRWRAGFLYGALFRRSQGALRVLRFARAEPLVCHSNVLLFSVSPCSFYCSGGDVRSLEAGAEGGVANIYAETRRRRETPHAIG